ncbi:MAG: hypothetical protein GYA50_01795 [Eubacteriaceae bacterium]|nr:hypothetical protein [Eubacteriaceae bacterium]
MEDKTRILNMVSEGKITVEEASILLDALDKKEKISEEPIAMKGKQGRKPTKLRVNIDANENSKKSKVNVNIPLSLVKTLGPIISKNLPKEAKEEMDKKGVDLVAIMNSIDEFIEAAGEEDIVNVDIEGDEPAKVRVYVE